MTPTNKPGLQVCLVWSADGKIRQKSLRVAPGTTALQAVLNADLAEELGIAAEQLAERIGIWGRHLDGRHRLSPDRYSLQQGDRIEIYHPLPVPPREARRRRQQALKQGKASPKRRTARARTRR